LKGFKILKQADITEMYGNPPIFEPLDYPSVTKQLKKPEGAFWCLLSYFDAGKVPIILQIIDLIDKNLIPNKTYFEFAQDFI